MKKARITVLGAGNVGATTANRLAESHLGEVVLVDVVEGMPQGKALDLAQAAALVGRDCVVAGADDYRATAASDVIVVTAGFACRSRMSRDDLRDANAAIVAECVRRVVKHSRDAVIVVVTNPLDAMCEVARRVSSFPPERIVGMSGVLDAARMRAGIAAAMHVSVDSVSALVLGSHDDLMVPLPRYSTVAGVPITALLPKETIREIVQRTIHGGDEIVSLLGTGSASWAPAAGVCEMVDSIVRDRKKVLPCSAYLRGEFELADVWLGVPCKLGAAGVERVIEVPLTSAERRLLARSAAKVRSEIDKLPGGSGKKGAARTSAP